MRVWPVERVETEMRRLRVLQYLSSASGYEANAQVLRLHCSQIGLPTTNDQLLSAIAWLEEAELIVIRKHADLPIARINADGREVSEGIRTQPGVMRPDP